MNSVTVKTSPSLALIKYWGKSDSSKNLPATSSLAITLDKLQTITTVEKSDTDRVFINGQEAQPDRFRSFFTNLRESTASSTYFTAKSKVNFPVAAGLASSSSGFAALALGCAQLIDPSIPTQKISEYARIGSASAARSLYGGFTIFRRKALFAEKLNLNWPELRVIIAIVTEGQKEISSRNAMELSRTTSPFYEEWIRKSEDLFNQSVDAASKKDLKALGPLIRLSYLSMFSTMLTSDPPILYWKPDSVALIHFCEKMRKEGFNLWETMDAGPQIKMICLNHDLEAILEKLKSMYPHLQFIVSKPGGAPQL